MGNFKSASPFTCGLPIVLDWFAAIVVTALELRVGDTGWSRSRGVREDVSSRGVQNPSFEAGVLAFWSFDGEVCGTLGVELAFVGVVGRIVVDGEAGDSGRRNGEVRGEPNERGEGL